MRTILFYNNPILRKKALPIVDVNGNIRQLITEMALVMKKANGIGIAAPQVGEPIQLAIVDPAAIGGMGGTGRIILINPRIVSAYGSEVSEEGCLSVPGVQVKIKRYKEVTVESLALDGGVVTYKGTGLLARAIQHEVDHLNGVLIIDRLSPVRRMLIKRKIKEAV